LLIPVDILFTLENYRKYQPALNNIVMIFVSHEANAMVNILNRGGG
jgi:hypothetical protein